MRETLDKLYLELSQVTKARNEREVRARALIEKAIGCIEEYEGPKGDRAPGVIREAKQKLFVAWEVLG